MEKQGQSRWRGDLLGGLVSAALSIPLAVGYGMFAFGSLGDSYFAAGALSGLYAAVAVGIACIVFGDRTTTVYAPRVTTTFFLGALLYELVHSGPALLGNGNQHLIVLAFFAYHLSRRHVPGFVRTGAAWLVDPVYPAPGHGRPAKCGGRTALFGAVG